MKKLWVFICVSLTVFGLLSCSGEIETTESSNLNYEYIYTQNENYYMLFFYNEQTDEYQKDMYDAMTLEKLYTLSESQKGRKIFDAYIYGEYLVVKEKSLENIYSVAIYDVRNANDDPIKRFYESESNFLVQQSNHYLIVNEKLGTLESTHSSIVYFLDLDDLYSWDNSIGINYQVETNSSSSMGFVNNEESLNTSQYAFFRNENTVIYALYSDEEVVVYSSDISDLFIDDQEIYRTSETLSYDSVVITESFVIQMEYDQCHLTWSVKSLDITEEFTGSNIIDFYKNNGLDSDSNQLGNGFSSFFFTNGNTIIIKDVDLTERLNDHLRFWIVTLYGNQEEIRRETFLFDTGIELNKARGNYFYLYNDTLYLYLYDLDNPSKLVLHKLSLEDGTIYR